MSEQELREELQRVRREIEAQYWRFTRCARATPVDPALRRREAAIEQELRGRA